MQDARKRAIEIIGLELILRLERSGMIVVPSDHLNALQAANEPQIRTGYVWTGNRGWVIND